MEFLMCSLGILGPEDTHLKDVHLLLNCRTDPRKPEPWTSWPKYPIRLGEGGLLVLHLAHERRGCFFTLSLPSKGVHALQLLPIGYHGQLPLGAAASISMAKEDCHSDMFPMGGCPWLPMAAHWEWLQVHPQWGRRSLQITIWSSSQQGRSETHPAYTSKATSTAHNPVDREE